MPILNYITCDRCKVQQHRENFWYGKMRHTTCKFCNKKTNIIPYKHTATTADVIRHLGKIVSEPRNNIPIYVQTQIDPVFEFLERQSCREQEKKNG